ncbi:hypothetical protein FJT64_010824 [Amphibalanus amphitrite]|uniref:EGF-like domain-containing protein n=1 Tax=Amphibalanus amphitrite TaxID=1232801 RepID=A0A6A4VNX4_AMPAM|nr:hypothetical protein FJT64_010824 [Amphibalanus amphitrite]
MPLVQVTLLVPVTLLVLSVLVPAARPLAWRQDEALCLAEQVAQPDGASATACAVHAFRHSAAGFRHLADGRCSLCAAVELNTTGGEVTFVGDRSACRQDADCGADAQCTAGGRCLCQPGLTADWDAPLVCRPIYDAVEVLLAESRDSALPTNLSVPWQVDCNPAITGGSVMTAIGDTPGLFDSGWTTDIDYVKCSHLGGGFQLEASRVTKMTLLNRSNGHSIHFCPNNSVVTALFDSHGLIPPYYMQKAEFAKCTAVGADWGVGAGDQCVRVQLGTTDRLVITTDEAADPHSAWPAQCPTDGPYAITALLAEGWHWMELVCCPVTKLAPQDTTGLGA